MAEEKPDLTAWTETFDSEDTLDRHWNYYGYLPEGGTVSDREHRRRYWQVEDGQVRGNIVPAVHGSGIGRPAKGTDVRLSFRFRLPPKGLVSCSLRGDNPIVDRNFSVMSLHVRPTGVFALDNTTLHPKDSPEAASPFCPFLPPGLSLIDSLFRGGLVGGEGVVGDDGLALDGCDAKLGLERVAIPFWQILFNNRIRNTAGNRRFFLRANDPRRTDHDDERSRGHGCPIPPAAIGKGGAGKSANA